MQSGAISAVWNGRRDRGRHIEFPEVDRGRWFSIHEAAEYILKAQAPLLQSLIEKIHNPG